MPPRYRTALAFRAALDHRLRREAAVTNRSLDRVIRLYLMNRFLARAIAEFGDSITLKGGVALELRLTRARATKDVDVRLTADRKNVTDRLRRATINTSAIDYLSFTIDDHPDHPEIDGDGVVYEGFRYRVQAYFATKPYGSAFGVDVAFGDPLTGTRDQLRAPNLLDIVDEPPLLVNVYPLATHLAEKLHAYTLPRAYTNHRMKDIIDVALIARELRVDGDTLRHAIASTFGFRRSHPVPPALPPPPDEWANRYPRVRGEDALEWPSLEAVYATAAAFLDPVLDGGVVGAWDPAAQAWR